MLRIALLTALALPLFACVEPTEEYHSVSWRYAGFPCTDVTVTITTESGNATSHGGYGCDSSGGFLWTSDDPPVSVDLVAIYRWEEPCGYLELFCTEPNTDLRIVGRATSAIDLSTETTTLVLQPVE